MIEPREGGIAIGRYLFWQMDFHANFHLLWKQLMEEAARHKSKYVVLLRQMNSLDLEATRDKLSGINQHLKFHNYVQSEGGYDLLLFNIEKVRRYGEPGIEQFTQFISWLDNKTLSEGHRSATLPKGYLVSKKVEKPKQSGSRWSGPKRKYSQPNEESQQDEKRSGDESYQQGGDNTSSDETEV